MTKKKTKDDNPLAPMDARPLFEKIKKLRERSNQVERDKFKKQLNHAFDSASNIALDRAFKENVITEKEWKHWRDDWGISLGTMCPLLQGHFNKKDGYVKKSDNIIVVTMPDSSTYKHRKFFSKRFDITILDPIEAMEQMMKDKDFRKANPKLVKQWEEFEE